MVPKVNVTRGDQKTGRMLECQSKMEWKNPELQTQLNQTDNTRHMKRVVENCKGSAQAKSITTQF